MRVRLKPVAWITAAVAALGLAGALPSVALPPPPGPAGRAVVDTQLAAPATAATLSATDESTEPALITASPGGLQIRPGRGDGTFAAPRNVPVPVVSPVAVAPLHAEEVLAA